MSGGSEEAVVSDRILTIPNVITVVRLACLPVFLWLLFARENRVAAAALLGVLGATDFLDGYIARHFNQVSTVGKVLDPVADRLLFIVGVGAIVIDGSVPVWFAVVVLVREVLVAGATLVLAAMGARRIDVTWWGKAGTFVPDGRVPVLPPGQQHLLVSRAGRVRGLGLRPGRRGHELLRGRPLRAHGQAGARRARSPGRTGRRWGRGRVGAR